jgi:hypothetical protein
MSKSLEIFKEALLSDLNCPITQELLKDPVVTLDGHTYEKIAILEWFKNNSTSPQTNLLLPSKQIIPNHTLKNIIKHFAPIF